MLPGGVRRREQSRGEEERGAELAAPDNRGGIGQGGALDGPSGEVRRRGDRGGGGRGGPAAEAEEAGDTAGGAGERSERRHCGCSLQGP